MKEKKAALADRLLVENTGVEPSDLPALRAGRSSQRTLYRATTMKKAALADRLLVENTGVEPVTFPHSVREGLASGR